MSGTPDIVERLREPYEQTQSRRPELELQAADRITQLTQATAEAEAIIAGLVEAIEHTRQLVANCAPSGFTDHDAVLELFENNATLTAALTQVRERNNG